MRVIGLGVGAALVSIVAAGCSSNREPQTRGDAIGSTGTISQGIQNGVTDTTHKFAVGVCIGNGAGQCWGICSGALIAPNVVITARHCVNESPHRIDCSANPTFGEQSAPQFWVTTNTTMEASGQGWYQAESLALPTDKHICGNDLAIFVLKTSVPKAEAEPIIPGVQYPMWSGNYAASFTAIGYGNTSPANQGSGTRRIIENVSVVCTPGSPYFDCPAEVNDAEFVGGDGGCSGDSGSSAYEQFSFNKGKPISFGVLSRGGESQDGTRCVGSIYSRLDKHRELIVDTVKAASKNWTLYPEPSWTTYVPPETDAGTDAKPPKPSKLGIGEACSEDKECEGAVCADPGDGNTICSQSCSDDPSSCPDGYSCNGELCLPTVTPPAETPKAGTPKAGCSASSEPEPTPWGWACALGAAAVVAAARRRRRALSA